MDFACGAAGRYVTVQMVASDAGDHVMRLCQIVPFTSPTPAAVAQSRARLPSPLAANWDVAHRYIAHMFGNEVLDEGNPESPAVSGAATGVVADGQGLQFTGTAPCVRFEQSPLTDTGEFSIVARFTSPRAFVPHSSVIIWEDPNTRLFMTTNGTAGSSMLAFAYGGGSIAWGGAVQPASNVSMAVVCHGGGCTVVRE